MSFKHDDIYNPYGLTLDKNGFVYIASYANDNIVLLPPDGKTSYTILTYHDGIRNPSRIDIYSEAGMMIVITGNNPHQTGFVYII